MLPAPHAISVRVKLGLLSLLVVYVVIRVMMVPFEVQIIEGFNHDSAYLSIVSQQVVAGHGMVNPANWLLFLQPTSLPMPFHNANPGYTLMIALTSIVFGVETARAAFLISALSSGLLAAGVFALTVHYVSWRMALALTAGVVFFPLNIVDSLTVLPDAMATGLAVAALAFAVRTKNPWTPVAAGVVLGASWLTRSSAVLVIPPLLWFLWRTRQDRVRAIGLLLVSFTVVISPWLWHTWQVWGSPFRSDAGLYLLQDYHARNFGGDIEHFWYTLDPPPGLFRILQDDLGGLVGYYLSNIPLMVYMVLAMSSDWSKPFVAVLCGMGIWAAFHTWHQRGRPEMQAGAMLLALNLGILTIRAPSFQPRYLGPALIVALIWLLTPLLTYFRAPANKKTGTLTAALLAASYFFAVAVQDLHAFQYLRAPSAYLTALRTDYQRIQQEVAGDSPVVIYRPYFYTLFTGEVSHSPPWTSKDRLLEFMKRYSVRYLVLPSEKVAYFYPYHASFGPELRELRTVGSLVVYERGQ